MFLATSGKGSYVLPTSRRSRFVLISFRSEEIRPSRLPHLQPNRYDPAQRAQSETPQASPSLRANLNSPTLHARIADTRFSSTLITYLKLEGRRTLATRSSQNGPSTHFGE